jgi:hypothetical protein
MVRFILGFHAYEFDPVEREPYHWLNTDDFSALFLVEEVDRRYRNIRVLFDRDQKFEQVDYIDDGMLTTVTYCNGDSDHFPVSCETYPESIPIFNRGLRDKIDRFNEDLKEHLKTMDLSISQRFQDLSNFISSRFDPVKH